jgi:hypothetical protein
MAEHNLDHDLDPRENPPTEAPELERPESHHEESDVNVWAVGKFAIVLALFCILALLGLAGLLRYWVTHETAENQEAPSAGLDVDARKLPPEPRLEVTPAIDLHEMRAAEDEILNSYGWIDREHGLVRIPIGRAMDLLAQRGLPTLGEQGPHSASHAVAPTESGMGQIMQQPGGPLAPELYPGGHGSN